MGLGRGGGRPSDSALTPPPRGLPLQGRRAEAADLGVGAEGEFPAGSRAGQAGERLRASETHVAKVRAGLPGGEAGRGGRSQAPSGARVGRSQSVGEEGGPAGLRAWGFRGGRG